MQPITAEQRESLAASGYLHVESLTGEPELGRLIEIYDRLFDNEHAFRAGNLFDLAGTDAAHVPRQLPQLLNPALYAPELLETELFVNAGAVVRGLLGADAVTRFVHAILKPAYGGAETPWHQDASYWGPGFVYRSLSVWVPLSDVDEHSGCMQFVPGSHNLDVLPHQSIDDDPRIHGLELTAAAMTHVADVRSVPCRAGDAVVHTPYTLHYSPPNDSREPRRAIVLIGGVKPIPRVQPLAQPWLADKRTARAQRAEEAAARGQT